MKSGNEGFIEALATVERTQETAAPQRGTKMGFATTISFILLSGGLATGPAGQAPLAARKTDGVDPDVQALLREASELALKQDKAQAFWYDRVLLQIGEVQILAGDHEGALRSIRGSAYSYGRNVGLARLAEALARDGKRERAFEIMRLLESPSARSPSATGHDVQLRWIEYLIASADLDAAGKAIEQLESKGHHPDARRQLAVAYAKSGDATRADAEFALAFESAAGLKDDSGRAGAMWQIAHAQLSVGKTDAAKKTIGRLVDTEKFQDPWAKVSAFKQSAVLTAKAGDDKTARQLFLRAIDAHTAVNAANKNNALMQIAQAQASVGHIEDALKTAWMIKHSEKNFTLDSYRERALYTIATAQLKVNDAEGAVRTALSIEHYLQYRDDALRAVVDHHIAKKHLKTALTTCEKFVNPSKRAGAILTVATAHAKQHDRKLAVAVAAQIELAQFDYRLPRTWGINYDAKPYFTVTSYEMSLQRTAEVAAAAMAFAQAIGQLPDQSYATLFNVNASEVTQTLARSHAATGDAKEAIAWAKQIGSGAKIGGDDKTDIRSAVEQRIHALIGVAEGMLERAGPAKGPETMKKRP
jgi:hypothetical protein